MATKKTRLFVGGIVGAFGGAAAAGAGANIFRTPSTFPAALAQAFVGVGGGGGISAPPSVSLAGFGGLGGGTFGGVLLRPNPGFQEALLAGGIGAFGGGGAAAAKFSFGALGKSLGALAPLLGFQLVAGLGEQSQAGSILGSLGGAAAGIGISGLIAGASAPGAFGSVLGLGAAAGPIALIAAPLLIGGAILLGKAKQRKADEEASGQLLTQAINAITELKAGIAGDQIEGAQARAIFDSQILGAFKQQISQLKTKSVVTSRLTNQVRDLEGVYRDLIPPEIAAQEERRRRGNGTPRLTAGLYLNSQAAAWSLALIAAVILSYRCSRLGSWSSHVVISSQ